MSPVAWLCAALGFLFAAFTVIAIVYDITAVEHGWTTISQWCLDAGRHRPIIPALITAVVFLILGALLGHLWFPQE
jgi:hypothetical protein